MSSFLVFSFVIIYCSNYITIICFKLFQIWSLGVCAVTSCPYNHAVCWAVTFLLVTLLNSCYMLPLSLKSLMFFLNYSFGLFNSPISSLILVPVSLQFSFYFEDEEWNLRNNCVIYSSLLKSLLYVSAPYWASDTLWWFLRNRITEHRMFFLSIRALHFLLALISKHLGFFALNTKYWQCLLGFKFPTNFN